MLYSRVSLFAVVVLVLAAPLARAQTGGETQAGVTSAEIAAGLADPTRWLTFSGDYTGQRHSPLRQITPRNVGRLAPQWTFQSGTYARGRGFETTPLALDGVLYVTGANGYAWAIDARTGRPFWEYRRTLPDNLTYGASAPVNRGFGILGERLFLVSQDAHLVALDRRSGVVLWDVELADYRIGYAATLAPLVVEDKVIVGISGGEYPTRGFVDAYEPATGKRVWRLYTVPGPGEPGSETWPNDVTAGRGGGGTWMTGSYDPSLGLLYWGTGNPNPTFNGADRGGDNLYTASLIAIEAATGKLRWHYQFTPHDIWDYDSTQMPVLADLTIGGEPRKVVLFANRNGFFYVLDRATGRLIRGTPFIETSWAKEIRPDGRPLLLPNSVPSEEGTKVCPDQSGGTNWMAPSFDPALGLFFVTARESCGVFFSWKDDYNAGDAFRGGAVQRLLETNYSALRAIDVVTGQRRWEFPYTSQSWAGVLSTASGLVFAGGSGNLMAFDAKSGKNLWHFQTGSSLYAGAISYMIDNRQYVLMPAGTTLTAFALADF